MSALSRPSSSGYVVLESQGAAAAAAGLKPEGLARWDYALAYIYDGADPARGVSGSVAFDVAFSGDGWTCGRGALAFNFAITEAPVRIDDTDGVLQISLGSNHDGGIANASVDVADSRYETVVGPTVDGTTSFTYRLANSPDTFYPYDIRHAGRRLVLRGLDGWARQNALASANVTAPPVMPSAVSFQQCLVPAVTREEPIVLPTVAPTDAAIDGAIGSFFAALLSRMIDPVWLEIAASYAFSVGNDGPPVRVPVVQIPQQFVAGPGIVSPPPGALPIASLVARLAAALADWYREGERSMSGASFEFDIVVTTAFTQPEPLLRIATLRLPIG